MREESDDSSRGGGTAGLDLYIDKEHRSYTTRKSPYYNVELRITYENGEPVDTTYFGRNWSYSHTDNNSDGLLLDKGWVVGDDKSNNSRGVIVRRFWNDLTNHFDSLEEQYQDLPWAQKILVTLKQMLGITGSEDVFPRGIERR